jgi:glycosyltransferase involved in cell wall biosynthesis
MTTLLRRVLIQFKDALRHSPFLLDSYGRWISWRCGAPGPDASIKEIVRTICRLTRAARNCLDEKLRLSIEKKVLACVKAMAGGKPDWNKLHAAYNLPRLEKAIILKPYVGEREKGVLFVSFEYQWLRLLHIPHLDEFARRYDLVLATSSSPPHNAINYLFPVHYPDRLFLLISHQKDIEYLPRLSPNVSPVPLLASNWVDPDAFQPIPFDEKDVDILMVGNFAAVKRHCALFKALRKMPPSLKVRLVGQVVDHRTADTIRAEARSFGVDDRIDLIQDALYRDMPTHFARSKISLVLSRREGSCVVVVESMFADTPVGLLANAHIGSRMFINEHTGRFLTEDDLAAQLMDFLADARHFSARQWALENRISCYGSTERLNAFLRERALAEGGEWTQDIVPHCWQPDPVHTSRQDRIRLEPAYEDVRTRFGIQIG